MTASLAVLCTLALLALAGAVCAFMASLADTGKDIDSDNT